MSLLGIRRTREVGTYGGRSSEVLAVWRQNIVSAAGLPGVIHAHGYGGGVDAAYWGTTYGTIPSVIAQRGMISLAGDLGSSANTYGTFGNDDTIDAIGDVIAYGRSSLGVTADPVHLLGGSMGATGVCNYAVRNPDEVASLTLIIPLVGLIDAHDNNRGGYATTIEAAYTNQAGWNAAKATHDPLTFAADLPDVPIRIYYSTNDPICVPDTMTAFQAITGCELVSIGAQGHYAAGLIDPDEIADFMWEANA
jgi:pimeloyl-ACP methyl ester carboxylesterase